MMVEIKQSRRRLVKLLIAGLLMMFVSLIILYIVIANYNEQGYQSSKLLRYKNTSLFFSIIGILFFGGGTILLIYEFIKATPLMTIDDKGITFRSGLTRRMNVLWGNIKSITVSNFFNQRFICIELDHIQEFITKQNFTTRNIIRLNRLMGQTSLTISLNSTIEKPEQVLAIMNKYLDEWKKNNE